MRLFIAQTDASLCQCNTIHYSSQQDDGSGVNGMPLMLLLPVGPPNSDQSPTLD